GGYGGAFRTTDGGANWQTLNLGTTSNLMRLIFPNPDTGFIFGTYGFLSRSDNQGNSWTTIPCPQNLHFLCAHVFTSRVMVAGTSWGKIVKSTDGGINWVEKHSESGEQIADICFTDALHGFAVSGHSKIYRTTDGGETWSVSQVGSFREYTRLSFINPLLGWISGSNGIMLRTTDGGAGWQEVFVGTHQAQNVVLFTDENNGYICGNGGMLLRTTNGGYTLTPEAPSRPTASPGLSLAPNPARRCVSISVDLPAPASLVIDLFSSAGEHVKTLDCGHRPAGTCRFSLPLEGIRPGIYLVNAIAQGQELARKLVVY
ncbi:MAG TPA: YCF48-related protein, partial [Bacteroidales bacterium]|nr:YCF48-related protein [Bacteroidales bacterium]